MIIVRLAGGMANQMFPYAAARRLAHRWQTGLKLDVRGLAAERQKNLQFPRRYALDLFNITAQIATEEEIAPFAAARQRGVLAGLRDAIGLGPKPRRTWYREPHFHFDPRVLHLPDHVYLDGNWVCEKYFADIADIIRREFTLKQPPAGRNRELLEEVKATESVSIHIRRGDYAAVEKVRQVHGVCEIDYYTECIRRIAELVPDPHFFIFSDEPQWAKEHLPLAFPAVFVEHNSPEQGHEDFRLMSHCRHNIVANSGFSWWAAWLNANPGKIVFAPRTWVKTAKYDTRDLVPADWLRV
jgi:hypothetical protein